MKTRYIFLFIILCGIQFSCNDDFLNKIPEDSVSDAGLWKTPEHLKLYVNNFYDRDDLLPKNNGSGWDSNPFMKDAFNGSDTQISSSFNSHLHGLTTLPSTGGGWKKEDWAALRDINYFFANYDKVVGEEKEINKYVAEAYFFRAIFYFNKVKQFGDVPFYENLLQIDSEELFKERDSRKVVIENILSDLDWAIEYLPSRVEIGNQRVNKEAAMLLQARIALYEGTWEKYHGQKNTKFKVEGSDGSQFIQKAASVTESLMALVGNDGLDNVGVENGYYNLFKTEDFKDSKEVFLWRKYSVADNQTHWWGRYSLAGASNGFSKSMIESYLCIDGKPIKNNPNYKGDKTLLDVVANRDPRLAQTIYVNDGKHFKIGDELFEYPEGDGSTGYQVYKGHNPNETQYEAKQCLTGQIYFRYGEALLIHAEAKAELGQFNQQVADNTVNKLRDRVGMVHMNVNEIGDFTKEFPTLSAEINEVRRERKIELAAEGFRRDDIFRWAAADLLIKGYIPLGAYKAQWEGTEASSSLLDKPVNAEGYILPYAKQAAADGYNFNLDRDYLWPLPTTELVLNKNLKQNPGW